MDYLKIGEFIKELRIENKLTQKEVAEILVVTPQTISKWELGTSLPSVDMLQSLSQIYHVSIDEIINCQIKESKSTCRTDSRNMISFIIYLLLFGIGITVCFVDYLTIDSRILVYGSDYFPFDDLSLPFTDVSVKLGNWLVIISTIFLPVLLATVHVLDKRRKILILIHVLAIILFITFLVPIIAGPGFITAQLGLILHIIYTLFLVLSTVITLSYYNTDVYRLINKHKKEYISATLLLLLAISIPFNYYSTFYYFYFTTYEHVLFFFMLIAPFIVIYDTVYGLKPFAIVYYVVLAVALILSSLMNIFNSGVLMGSFLQLIYVLILVIPNYKQDSLNFNLKKLMVSNFLYVEIISLVVYLYYYINPGDLFFASGIDIIYISDTAVKQFFHLNIILLLLAMIVRVANIKSLTKVFDMIWITWVAYFTYIILTDYFFNPKYITTDGIYLDIPPILIALYIIFALILLCKRKSKRIDTNIN